MYQITQPKIKCSVCNEINNYTDFSIEKFTKTFKIRKCLNCGHEKVLYVLTVSTEWNFELGNISKDDINYNLF
ncbi:hypothetical protein M0Q50_05825 [bacterium]|jgi:ferredoxin-like protein FixX|nr:hypothetical protein [bacterium]